MAICVGRAYFLDYNLKLLIILFIYICMCMSNVVVIMDIKPEAVRIIGDSSRVRFKKFVSSRISRIKKSSNCLMDTT